MQSCQRVTFTMAGTAYRSPTPAPRMVFGALRTMGEPVTSDMCS